MPAAATLKFVREQRHFDLEDVAANTHISASRLGEFETGDREPSINQIEKLAKVYGVPAYLLFSEAAPNLPETLPDFRRTKPEPARLSPAGMQKVWAAHNVAEFAKQLSAEVEVSKPRWTRALDLGTPTRTRARALREFFDDWHSARQRLLAFTGTSEQRFLGAFRLFLEVQGTIVNVNQAPTDDFMGFYIDADGELPLLFVNRTIASKKAQLFTLLHEYGHHLMDEDGISNPFVVRNSIERTCNKFAAEFLAPMAQFSTLVESQARDVRRDPFALVREISEASLLSRHATAIRLVEGGYLSDEQLRTWERATKRTPNAEKQEEAEAAGDARGPVHAKRIGELGYLPTVLASRAVKDRLVDSLDVQTGLGLSESLQEQAFTLAERRFAAAQA